MMNKISLKYDQLDSVSLPDERVLAISHTGLSVRRELEVFFALDARLGHQVAQASEPLLGQIRLAWWREQLSLPPAQRAQGDPLLDAIEEVWAGDAGRLVALVDAWEELLGEAPLPVDGVARFAAGRATPITVLAEKAGRAELADDAKRAGECWALVDLAWKTSDPIEREAALSLANEVGRVPPLPRSLGGVRLLYGLARHSLATRKPLFVGRSAAFVALRVGLIGR